MVKAGLRSLLVFGAAILASAAAPPTVPVYKNPALPAEQRITNLPSLMPRLVPERPALYRVGPRQVLMWMRGSASPPSLSLDRLQKRGWAVEPEYDRSCLDSPLRRGQRSTE